MNKFLAIVGLVIVAAGVVWGLSLVKAPQSVVYTPVLQGEQLGEGSMVYHENEAYYTIEALYPFSTELSPAADAKVRMTIESAIAERIAEFKENGNFAALTAEDIKIQGLGVDRKYALGMEYKAYAGADTVSYLYAIYEDTLGAHPNAYFMSFVFDKQGKQLGITDILATNPNGLEELSLLVSNDVTAQMKARTGVDDVSGSSFAEGLAPKVENFSTFVIDGDTLVLALPPYQVAAYAVGSFEVRIQLKDIQ